MPMETGNMKPDYNKVILTDADGVLLNWEYAFRTLDGQTRLRRKV